MTVNLILLEVLVAALLGECPLLDVQWITSRSILNTSLQVQFHGSIFTVKVDICTNYGYQGYLLSNKPVVTLTAKPTMLSYPIRPISGINYVLSLDTEPVNCLIHQDGRGPT